jgi:hypothetical protein
MTVLWHGGDHRLEEITQICTRRRTATGKEDAPVLDGRRHVVQNYGMVPSKDLYPIQLKEGHL